MLYVMLSAVLNTEISVLFDKSVLRAEGVDSINIRLLTHSCNTIMISYSFGGKVYVYYSETRDIVTLTLVSKSNATACATIHSVLQVMNCNLCKILDMMRWGNR